MVAGGPTKSWACFAILIAFFASEMRVSTSAEDATGREITVSPDFDEDTNHQHIRYRAEEINHEKIRCHTEGVNLEDQVP
eukprot:3671307-Pyramimonas_sp.AAC.1